MGRDGASSVLSNTGLRSAADSVRCVETDAWVKGGAAMWESLQTESWDELIWLVVVPAALILVMILAGIYTNVHK